MSLPEEIYDLLNNKYGYAPKKGDNRLTYKELLKDEIWLYFGKPGGGEGTTLGFYVAKNLQPEIRETLSTVLAKCIAMKKCSEIAFAKQWIYCTITDKSAFTPNMVVELLENLESKAAVSLNQPAAVVKKTQKGKESLGALSEEVYKLLNDKHGYVPEEGDDGLKTYKVLHPDVIWLYFEKASEGSGATLGFYVAEGLQKAARKTLSAVLDKRIDGIGNFWKQISVKGWIYCTIVNEKALEPDDIVKLLENLESEAENSLKQTEIEMKETVKNFEGGEKEYYHLQKVKAYGRRLTHTLIFCCIGWTVFSYGNSMHGIVSGLLMILGAFIVTWPMLGRVWGGSGFRKMLTVLDDREGTEVETTTIHSDGSVSKTKHTEYGPSGSLFVLFGVICLGCLITALYLVYLVPTYTLMYLTAKKKPSLLRSAFPVMIIGFVVLVGAPKVFSPKVYNIVEARQMFEETKRDFLAQSFSYSFERADLRGDKSKEYQGSVSYKHADSTTIIEITASEDYIKEHKKGTNKILPGRYTFRADSLLNSNRKPNSADIEAVRELLPANFFFRKLPAVKDSELYAGGIKGASKDEFLFRIEEQKAPAKTFGINRVQDVYREELKFYVNKAGDTYRIESGSVNDDGGYIHIGSIDYK